MTEKDFAISSIELTHDQAISLYQRIIESIENYGVQNFDIKTEIQVPELTEDDLIKVYVELETYTEWKEKEKPDPEEITSRSVIRLKIQLINIEGDEVEFKVLGEKERSLSGRLYEKSPIDICEKIENYFSV